MAFFALKTISIVSIVIGIVLVVGVLVIVALKIFHQNKEEKQVELAKHGVEFVPGETYVVGKNVAEGKYSFTGAAAQTELRLTLNGEEKTLQSGDVLVLKEDDRLSPQVAVVATICK